MKNAIILMVGMFLLVSCSDFLEKTPENSIDSGSFLSTENELEIYANGFLQKYLPGEEDVTFGDQYADNIATRSSTNFLIGDTWTANDQGGWGTGNSGKWAELRNINYFLDHLNNSKKNVSDEIYRHYEGVGRFWRAWFYYDMVRTFGDVPWYEHEIDITNAELLYKARDSREFVMDKVLEDLNFAAENCSSAAKFTSSSNRINKWVALAFKSRVCLFEGTYRKYHGELNLSNSVAKFLNASTEASETLMKDGPYSLVNSLANLKTQYRALFNSESLNTQEVILGLTFQTDVRMSSVTWKLFSATNGLNWSLTKQFVNQYLMLDGSRFTEKSDYKTTTYNNEFENRDYRLQQTVSSPEYTRKIGGTTKLVAPNFSVTLTGYKPIKWALDDDAYDSKANSYNSIPVIRYAEILLNYAEAKAELGQCDQTVWNKTIRLLRERAGVNGDVPSDYDPYLADYYLNQTTDKWILEIRRERGIELVFENVRFDDIMRWKMGRLIENTWQGIYIPQKGEAYDLNNDGIKDVAVVDVEPSAANKIPGVKYIVIGSSYRLSEGDKGYMEYGFNLNRKWYDKKYLHPIPTAAQQDNPALGQNTGW